MKTTTLILKILAGIATVVGVVFLVATYGDKVVAWFKRILGRCPCEFDCDECECDGDCDDCECDCCDCCECEEEEAEEEEEEEELVAAEADFEE